MSRHVEENTVKMRFDNQDFNGQVIKSQNLLLGFEGTLKSLPSNIEIGLKGLLANTSLGDILNFAAVTTGIRGIKNEILSIANPIETVASKALNTMSNVMQATITQINNGGKQRALDIAQAKFQIEGLGLSVDTFMEASNYAVEGTAYGLNEAAKVASQLGASGVTELGELKKALRAVSGVAAMTNRSYEDMGHIFTVVASNGKLMTEQIRSFSYAGLNVTAKLAKYLGVTEHEIEEMVKKGQIDFKTFYTAMDEAFGEHAKDANKTFTGAISNIKAALNRIGEGIWTPIIEQSIDLLNTVRVAINDLKAELTSNEVFINFANAVDVITGKLDKFANNIKKVIHETPLIESVSTVLNGLFEMAKDTVSAFNFDYSLTTNAIAKDFSILVKKIGEVIFAARDAFNEVFGLWNVAGKFQSIVHWAADLLQLLDDIKQDDVKDLFTSWLKTLKKVFETITDILGINRKNLGDIFQGAVDTIVKLLDKLKISDERMDKITRTFRGFAAALDIVKMLLIAVFDFIKPVFSYIEPIEDFLLNASSSFGDMIYNLRNSIKEGNEFGKFFDFVSEKIAKVLEYAKKFGGKFIEIFFGGDDTGKDEINKKTSVFQWIADFFSKIIKFISSIFEDFKIEGIDLSPIQKFLDSFANLGFGEGKTGETLEQKKDKILNFFDMLIEFVHKLGELYAALDEELSITERFENVNDKIYKIFVLPLLGLFGMIAKVINTALTGFNTMDSKDKKRVLIVLINTVYRTIKLIFDKIESFYDKIEKSTKNVKNAVIGAPLAMTILKIVTSVLDVVHMVEKGFNPIGSVVNSVKTFIKEIGKLDLATVIHGREKISDILKSIALVIAAIAGALFVIALIPSDRLWPAIGALMLFVAVIGALFIALGLLSKYFSKTNTAVDVKDGWNKFNDAIQGIKFESSPIVGLGKAIKMIAEGLVLIAAAIWIATKAVDAEHPGKFIGAIIGLIAILSFITLFLIALEAISIANNVKSTDYTAIGGAFALIGLSVALIASAIFILTKAFTGISVWTALGAIGTVIVIVGAVGGLIVAMAAVAKKDAGLSILMGGVAMMMAFEGLCHAMLGIAAAILMLGMLPADKISSVGTVISGILVILVIFSAVIGVIGAIAGASEAGMLGLLAMALVMFSLASTILSLAPVLLAAAIVVSSITKFFETMQKLFEFFAGLEDADVQKILKNAAKVFLGIASLLPLMVSTYITVMMVQLAKLFPVINTFVATKFCPFLNGLLDLIMPSFLAKVLQSLGELLNVIMEYFPTIEHSLYTLIFTVSGGGLLGTLFYWLDKIWDDTNDWMVSRIPTWVEDIYKIIITLVKAINATLSNNWDEVNTELQTLIDLTLGLLHDLLTGEKTTEDVRLMIEGLCEAIKKALGDNEENIKAAFREFGETLGGALVEGIKGAVQSLAPGIYDMIFDDGEGLTSGKSRSNTKKDLNASDFTRATPDLSTINYNDFVGGLNAADFTGLDYSGIDISGRNPGHIGTNEVDSIGERIVGAIGNVIGGRKYNNNFRLDIDLEANPPQMFHATEKQNSLNAAAGMVNFMSN